MQGSISPLRFGLKFALLFLVQFSAYEAARGSPAEESFIHSAVLQPSTWLISIVSPPEIVRIEGRNLVTPNSSLHITRGCEGVEMLFLLTAAILAFPADRGRRAFGLAVGMAVIYALTLGRIAILHFALRYHPDYWDSLHGLVLPLVPVILVAWYFMAWSTREVPHAEVGRARP